MADILQAMRDRATTLIDSVSWGTSNPAALGVATTVQLSNDNAGYFEIDYIQFTAWPVAALGTSVAYTELCEEASTGTANTNYSYAGLSARIETDQKKYIRTLTPVRHFAGNARSWLPLQTKMIIVPGAKLRVELFNNLAIAVYANMSFFGRLIPTS